jgi:radical SAM superfamily enzyme YgiQ (UPF0313 family)
MKVLFIYPTMVSEAPMTLAMLSGVAKRKGWETKSLVNTFKKPLSINEFVFETIKYKPDIVAISMITFEVLFVRELIRKLRKAKFFVVVGGAHPTDCPEECIEAGANVVIVGEGENVLKKILFDYEANEHIEQIQKGEPIDLSELPLPDLDVFDRELFTDKSGFIKGFHRIYTSRGCPGTCTFCDWQVFKQNWRPYPTEHIIADIKKRMNYGINTFSIADDCFTVDRERAIELAKEFKKLGIVWRTNSRADLVDYEMLKTFKDCGCHSIALGLESGDSETLKRVGKRVTLEQNIEAPKLAHKAGLEVYGCLMTGFPWETTKHVENQIKFVHELWNDVSLFQVSGSLMPFPGAAIYRQYAKEYQFEEYWLKPDYQKLGIQVYQNAENPLAVSTFYQRYLFDDTYIQRDYFFTYSKDYKKAVRRLVWEIGKHNMLFMFPGRPLKQKLVLLAAKLSMMLYDINPEIEMKIGGRLFRGKSKIESVRDKRRGFVK